MKVLGSLLLGLSAATAADVGVNVDLDIAGFNVHFGGGGSIAVGSGKPRPSAMRLHKPSLVGKPPPRHVHEHVPPHTAASTTAAGAVPATTTTSQQSVSRPNSAATSVAPSPSVFSPTPVNMRDGSSWDDPVGPPSDAVDRDNNGKSRRDKPDFDSPAPLPSPAPVVTPNDYLLSTTLSVYPTPFTQAAASAAAIGDGAAAGVMPSPSIVSPTPADLRDNASFNEPVDGPPSDVPGRTGGKSRGYKPQFDSPAPNPSPAPVVTPRDDRAVPPVPTRQHHLRMTTLGVPAPNTPRIPRDATDNIITARDHEADDRQEQEEQDRHHDPNEWNDGFWNADDTERKPLLPDVPCDVQSIYDVGDDGRDEGRDDVDDEGRDLPPVSPEDVAEVGTVALLLLRLVCARRPSSQLVL